MSPAECKSRRDAELLASTSHDVGNFSMEANGLSVVFFEQVWGEMPSQRFYVPRATLNKLLDWYQKEQKPK